MASFRCPRQVLAAQVARYVCSPRLKSRVLVTICNQVHEGFQSAYNAVSGPVSSAVKSALSSGYRLIVTGHSLGGGIAAVATTSFIGQGMAVAETYTFGEPRNGDAQWAKYVSQQIPDANYYRVTHFNDGVPQIPPTILGYVHHGPEYFQSKNTGNTAQTTLKCSLDSKVSRKTYYVFLGLTKTNHDRSLVAQARTLGQTPSICHTSLTVTQ